MSETRLFYVDDSGAPETGYAVYSWCEVAISDWTGALADWLAVRAKLTADHQIPKNAELHATELVNGRGRPSLDDSFNRSKARRRQAMDEVIAALSAASWLSVGTVYSQGPKREHRSEKTRVYEELVALIDQRLQATGDHGILIMDGDGTDPSYLTAHRQLDLGTRNLIEDPAFQHSHRSQWVQIADLVAYSAYQSLMQLPEKRFAWPWYPALAARDVLGGPQAV